MPRSKQEEKFNANAFEAFLSSERSRKSSLSQEEKFNADAFEAFLSSTMSEGEPRVSERSRKCIMRVARKLISGKGVQHQANPGETFLADYMVTPADDIEALRKQAALWLPYRQSDPNKKDKGHGWALNHPLKWLIRYKKHLMEGGADILLSNPDTELEDPDTVLEELLLHDSMGSSSMGSSSSSNSNSNSSRKRQLKDQQTSKKTKKPRTFVVVVANK